MSRHPGTGATQCRPRGEGHVLITSRNPAWGGRHATIDVECLDQETSARYLLARAVGDAEPAEAERAAAGALADELGGLPLALAQAAAYIDAYGETLAGYLSLFRAGRARLLADAPGPLDYQGTVHTAVSLAVGRLADEPSALGLLELLAFLGPETIPLELLLGDTGTVELPVELAGLAGPGRGHERNRLGIGPLRAVSLVERGPAGVKVHRLTQTVVRDQLDPDRRAARLATAVALVEHALDLDPEHPDNWAAFAALLPAARAAADHTRILDADRPAGLVLLHRLGRYLFNRGDLAGARALQEQALAVRREVLGDRHPDTLRSINNLAATLYEQGDLAGARTLQEQALAVCREVLGDRHPHTLTSINNLANTLRAQGDLAGARTLHEETLAVRREVLGDHHPDTLSSINNLAATLQAQGDLASAYALAEEAVAGSREVLGDRHPFTLELIHTLAETLRAQGDLAGARVLHEEALAGRRDVLGVRHPDTVTSAWDLYRTLADLDPPAAITVLDRDLRWLLDEDPERLTADQARIRTQVAEAVRTAGSGGAVSS
ncbi:MAG: FxSxx-COOH system tetratricopeptide repeat protein [Egibacteraceae bacterium]